MQSQQPAAGQASVDTPPVKIFINYRHDDLGGEAWALYGRLYAHYGGENVFFDNGNLQPGDPWFEEIKLNLAGAAVFLSLIGPKWMPELLERARSDADDYVVKEIEMAWKAEEQVRVIPLLLKGAILPERDQLPPSIRWLTSCQAQRLSQDNMFDDIDRLIRYLDALPRTVEPPKEVLEPAAPDVATIRAAIATPPDGGDAASAPERPSHGPRPPDSHYQAVVDQADNIVVFLGAGVNADEGVIPWNEASGVPPDDPGLAKYLAAKVKLKLDHEPLDLAEVAQQALTLQGETKVYGWVKEVLQTSEPGRVHRYLAHFRQRLDEIGLISRYQMIVTAKYDAELERALQLEREPFDVAVYMGPGTDHPGKFMHVPWDKEPVVVNEPNNYTGFPFTENGQLSRTLVVRINGVVEDHDAGYGGKGWKDNFVIAEDHYIDYLSGRTAEDLIPAQILAKLREASKLFLGYSMRDWRLRVFLKRIWQGQNLVRSRAWAVERDPDELERQLWLQSSVEVVPSSLIDYVDGFDAFLLAHRDELAQ